MILEKVTGLEMYKNLQNHTLFAGDVEVIKFHRKAFKYFVLLSLKYVLVSTCVLGTDIIMN